MWRGQEEMSQGEESKCKMCLAGSLSQFSTASVKFLPLLAGSKCELLSSSKGHRSLMRSASCCEEKVEINLHLNSSGFPVWPLEASEIKGTNVSWSFIERHRRVGGECCSSHFLNVLKHQRNHHQSSKRPCLRVCLSALCFLFRRAE